MPWPASLLVIACNSPVCWHGDESIFQYDAARTLSFRCNWVRITAPFLQSLGKTHLHYKNLIAIIWEYPKYMSPFAYHFGFHLEHYFFPSAAQFWWHRIIISIVIFFSTYYFSFGISWLIMFFFHFPCPWHLKSRKTMRIDETSWKTIRNEEKWRNNEDPN